MDYVTYTIGAYIVNSPDALTKAKQHHKLDPIPSTCSVCNNGQVDLHVSRGLRIKGKWPLIYRCNVCQASVPCVKGTDIPMAPMADMRTIAARKSVRAISRSLVNQYGIELVEVFKTIEVILETQHVKIETLSYEDATLVYNRLVRITKSLPRIIDHG